MAPKRIPRPPGRPAAADFNDGGSKSTSRLDPLVARVPVSMAGWRSDRKVRIRLFPVYLNTGFRRSTRHSDGGRGPLSSSAPAATTETTTVTPVHYSMQDAKRRARCITFRIRQSARPRRVGLLYKMRLNVHRDGRVELPARHRDSQQVRLCARVQPVSTRKVSSLPNFVYGSAQTRSFAVAPRRARLVCQVDGTWVAGLREQSDEKCSLKGILLHYDAPSRCPF